MKSAWIRIIVLNGNYFFYYFVVFSREKFQKSKILNE